MFKLFKKNKNNVSTKEIEQEIKIKQKANLAERDVLKNRRAELIDDLALAKKAGDDLNAKIFVDQIKIVDDQIEALDVEYKKNDESLVNHTKIDNMNSERKGEKIVAGATVLSAIGGLGLGVWSLKKAYDSDQNGTLVNKKVLDVFNKINPLGWIKKK